MIQDGSAKSRHRGAGFAVCLNRGVRGVAGDSKRLQPQEVLAAIGRRRSVFLPPIRFHLYCDQLASVHQRTLVAFRREIGDLLCIRIH